MFKFTLNWKEYGLVGAILMYLFGIINYVAIVDSLLKLPLSIHNRIASFGYYIENGIDSFEDICNFVAGESESVVNDDSLAESSEDTDLSNDVSVQEVQEIANNLSLEPEPSKTESSPIPPHPELEEKINVLLRNRCTGEIQYVRMTYGEYLNLLYTMEYTYLDTE